MPILNLSRATNFRWSKLFISRQRAITVPIVALLLALSVGHTPSAHAQTCPFDDGNSSLGVEGLILTRYALGITGAPLVASTNINAVDAPTVEAAINCPSCGLNITGNPTMTVADATIISRKLAGFSGAALTNNLALGSGTRNTPAAVQGFLLAGCGATGGTVTSITAGTGLTGGVITGAGTLAADTAYLQRRVSSSCAAGSFITTIAADGTVTCGTPAVGGGGTVTSVATGAGLTGGPISTTGTVSIAAGGVTAALLAPNLSLGGTTTGTFNGPLTGNVTGNVSGNVSGSAASFSGALAGDVTGTQAATVIAAPTVTGKALTGFVSGAGTVSASDSILTAINKLDGNIKLQAPLASPLVVNPFARTVTTVDSAGDVGYYSSITLGADGLPVISYTDGTSATLKVAKCINAACTGATTLTTVDNVGNVGAYTSITLGADGLPVISYYDITNGDLKVAKCINPACTGASTLTTVDSVGNVGAYTSITLGADGLPVISYYDVTNFRLKVAKCTNAACTGASILTTVDSAGNVGAYTSITLGADGLPVISYYDGTSGDLKVAKCINPACTGASTLTTVDSLGNVGQYTSITLGADGLPVISYYDASNARLTVAKCINAACTGASTITAVAFGVSAGEYTSITLGADGMPVISYYDLGHLKVAKCISPACNVYAPTLTTVDSAASVGYYSSITLGADGLPVISYFDSSNGDLKVAKCTSASCVPYVRRR